MGLRSKKTYLKWCQENGFPETTNKRQRQLTREHDQFIRKQADAVIPNQCSTTEVRSPNYLLKLIDKNARPELQPYPAHRVFIAFARSMFRHCRSGRADLKALVELCVSRRCRFLDPRERWRGAIAEDPIDRVLPGQESSLGFLGGLVVVAKHANHWRRPLEKWKPKSRNATRQFRSLLRHLFVDHEALPEFFDHVWLEGRMPSARLSESSVSYREWYRQLGAGQNLRRCQLPISCTKKMAFFVLKAPADSSMPQALVWGQLRALGADERLADAAAISNAVLHWQQNEFWQTVFRWLIAQPMLDVRQVGPIIDYIHHRRFQPAQVLLPDGTLELEDPPEPRLSMRGRTADSILRQVEAWHDSLARQKKHSVNNWATIGLPALNLREGDSRSANSKLWKIRELISTSELVAEGRKLKHCVASYARSCAQRQCSIWTMELERAEGTEKLLTIEVRPAARAIVQIRGKYNRLPTEQERRIIRLWASQAKLSVSRRLS